MSAEGGWVKSSRSLGNGNCVEVKVFDDGSADVRNSRRPEDGVLHFTPDEWDAFIRGVRNGEFDRFAADPQPAAAEPDDALQGR